ncbi:ATP-binding cassette domain-containing protein [Alphaproteobacteria bacterium HT1-32]|nr:ATP-binding cassette domain-containing protein [Alphaproteobacteria bacterium HT1-32]
MTMILRTTGISKQFGSVQALRDVSLDVAPGERVALLGHNGAGKTTLFRIVLGFIRADAGTADVNGHPPGSPSARRYVSYLPENVAFPKMLTGREVVSYYAKLKSADNAEVAAALEKVDLVDAADRRCGTYSKGMRQRLGLAQALVGKPKLLLLDEPTSGLDPLSRQRFYDLVSDIANAGAAVLLSSHGLSELEAKTDRVAILRRGELVANAPLAELQRSANLPVRIRIRSNLRDVEAVHRALGGDRVNGLSVELSCLQPDKMARLSEISALGDAVNDVDVSPPNLDEIYRYFLTADDVTEQKP